MNVPDRSGWDLAAWTAAFADGRANPTDLLKSCLERIERWDGELGICNHVADHQSLLDRAAVAARRWQKGAPLSPLDGVPFGVKANIAVSGLPWHGGIAAFKEVQASTDADCVERLRSAGMIPMAVLNMHEAALGETTDNPAFRTTRNPHAADRIPGGSSGGSAAAVAAGFVPVTLGTDSLGSVRLPSALCGVVGFKPARDQIPVGGVLPLSQRLDHVGIHGRSVADVAAMMRLFPASEQPRAEADSASPTLPLARWDVAMQTPTAPEIEAAFHGLLSDHGVTKHIDWLDMDLSKVRRAGLLMCERDAAEHYARPLCDLPNGFSATFRQLVAWGAAQPEEKVARAERLLAATAERLRTDLSKRLLLSPTTTHLAPSCSGPIPVTLADLTAPAAIAGLPSVTVPMPSSGNLPVGLQITGIDESEVLAAARTLFPGVASRVP